MIKFPNTQETKTVITDSEGNLYYDFLQKDINIPDSKQGPIGIDYFLVTKDTAMRIDLIAKAMNGTITDCEKILKFNGISNPLAIDEGDILVVFDPISLKNSLRNTSNASQNKLDVRKQYLTPEKKSEVDPKLQEFSKRQKAKKSNTNSTALPPNYAGFGDKEIEIRNGKIYFGTNVTKSSSYEPPLSKSEYIARLIKNKKK
jgi:hypothetical protein